MYPRSPTSSGSTRSARLSRRAVPACLALCLAATAASAAAEAPRFSGTLQIINSSKERLRVHVDGLFLGHAAPAWSASFTSVAGGQRALLLTTESGTVRATAPVFVPGGGMFTWSVPANTAPPPVAAIVYPPGTADAMAATASLQVQNRHNEPVQVVVAGKLLGLLQAGETAVYTNITPGLQIFQAKQATGGELKRQDLELTAGARQYVNLLPPAGILRLANTRPDAVEVFVDNAQSFPLAPGASMEIPNVLPGQRTLSARVGGTEQAQTTVTVYPGQVASWVVRAVTGTIRVVNRMPEPILLSVDGAPQPNPLLPGRERYITGVPAGVHKLAASSGGGELRNARDLSLTAGETRLWLLEL